MKSQNEKQLVIFTYADKKYSLFVIPYIYFALKHNEDAFVEVVVEDLSYFLSHHSDGIKQLDKMFESCFEIRESSLTEKYANCTPNVKRFIEPPLNEAKYVYIGDIDLLILENITSVHEQIIQDNNLEFSNIVRQPIVHGKPRLSGLHFCEFKKMFPLPNIDDLDLLSLNDEHVLFEIMARKGYTIPHSFKLRPECGVHVSLSRSPLGNYSHTKAKTIKYGKNPRWSLNGYDRNILEVLHSSEYLTLSTTFSNDFKLLMLILESLISGDTRLLETFSMKYLSKRFLFMDEAEVNADTLLQERKNFLAIKDMEQAKKVSKILVSNWPDNVDYWNKLLWIALSTKDSVVINECIKSIRWVDGSNKILRNLNQEKLALFLDTESKDILKSLIQESTVKHSTIDDLIFVCGGGHSGTTLMLAILDSHKDIQSIPHETGVFHRLENDEEVLIEVGKWKSKYQISENAKYYVEKTPVHGAHIERILKLFPRSKIIFMTRDGRDASLSEMKRVDCFDAAVSSWKKINSRAMPLFSDPRVKVVKYENLVESLPSVTRDLCSFLSLDYDETMNEYYKVQRTWWDKEIKKPKDGAELKGQNHKSNRNWQINQPIFKSENNWVSQMTSEQKVIFKKKAGELLIKLGYANDENW